ncbi:DUF6541 family protein [Arthrobacter sp. D2-10]
MSWIQIAPAFACALALAFVPGGLLAYTAGARSYHLLALAAPLSISLVALSAIVAAPLSIRFGFIPLLGLTVASCTVALLARRMLRCPLVPPTGHHTVVRMNWSVPLTALAVASSLIGSNFIKIIERPDNFSQTYDNIFHMSAVRYIADSGSGTSLTMGMLGTGPNIFYPAAWHDFVALIHLFTGASIPVAITAASLVIGAFIWPASCLLIATVLCRPRPLVMLGTAVISTGFGAFPYLMINFGVLYPYLLALAILPAAIALVCELFRVGMVRRTPTDRRVIGLFLGALVPGLGLAHPSALLFLMLVVLLFTPLPFLKRLLAPGDLRRKLLSATAMVGVLTVSTYVVREIWTIARPTRGASFWPPTQTSAQALGEIATLAPMRAPIAWLMLALILTGMYSALRFQLHRWTLIPMLLGSFLYVVVTSFPNDDVRYFITGIWYNDAYRLAALLPIALLPVILLGWRAVSDAYERMAAQVVRTDNLHAGSASIGLNAIALILLIAATQGDSVTYAVRTASESYGISENSPLISADEAALLERVPELVPESATVVGNPYTGASLVYALADRSTPSPHVAQGQNPQAQVLLNELDEMLTNPEVCSVVENMGQVFVLDFGPDEVHGGSHPFKGTDSISPATGFELVAQEGEASLWKAVGC